MKRVFRLLLSLIVIFTLNCGIAPKYGDDCTSSGGVGGKLGKDGHCYFCDDDARPLTKNDVDYMGITNCKGPSVGGIFCCKQVGQTVPVEPQSDCTVRCPVARPIWNVYEGQCDDHCYGTRCYDLRLSHCLY